MGNYHARFYEGLGRGDAPSLLSTGNNSLFTYDGFGRVVKIVETVGGTINSTTQFVSADEAMAEQRNSAGALVSQYAALGQKTAGSSYFYFRDHINSIREVTNSAGITVAQYTYDLYGKVTAVSNSVPSDFQFGGYYHHAPSGLSITMERAYSAALGHWINRDPIAEAGGVNLYGYVLNRPSEFTDPSGMLPGITPPALPGRPDPTPKPPTVVGGAGGAPPPPDGGGGYKTPKFDWGTLNTPEMQRLLWWFSCFFQALLGTLGDGAKLGWDKLPPEQAAPLYLSDFSFKYWLCMRRRFPPQIPGGCNKPQLEPPADNPGLPGGGKEPPKLPYNGP